MDIAALPLILALIAAFCTAVFHSVGGFAGALLLAICLAPIIGVKETVPVTATAMVISNCTRVWVFRKSVDSRAFLAIFATATPFIILSAVIYISLPVAIVALILGVFLILSVPLQRTMARLDVTVSSKGLAASAVPYGLLSGSTFGAGMLLAPFLIGYGLAGEMLVGTVASIGFGLNVLKSVVFGFSPLLTPPLLLKGILIGLATVPGAFVGRWIVRSTPLRIHKVFMETLILCGGLYFLYEAAREFQWL